MWSAADMVHHAIVDTRSCLIRRQCLVRVVRHMSRIILKHATSINSDVQIRYYRYHGSVLFPCCHCAGNIRLAYSSDVGTLTQLRNVSPHLLMWRLTCLQRRLIGKDNMPCCYLAPTTASVCWHVRKPAPAWRPLERGVLMTISVVWHAQICGECTN
ncbi:hypothetical protein BDZ89DRAFT_458694 [Hymenopellis radicata]|nr:hypothetical protein BDZ89DRAFT_458694 [Hymenopellis radicata]